MSLTDNKLIKAGAGLNRQNKNMIKIANKDTTKTADKNELIKAANENNQTIAIELNQT